MEIKWVPLGQSIPDKIRAAHYRWLNMPPGLIPELASKFMLGLHGRKTVKDLTDTGDHYICSYLRFKKHCLMHPEWGAEARRLSELNSTAKKIANHYSKGKQFEFCKSGRHRMEGDNLMKGSVHRSRFCRACWLEKMTRPMTAEEITAVKHAVMVEKRTINNITNGTPLGGGPRDRSRVIVSSSILAAQYKRDPAFAAEIRNHIAGNISRAQRVRYSRIAVATVRQ